jgi:hypothetical protein
MYKYTVTTVEHLLTLLNYLNTEHFFELMFCYPIFSTTFVRNISYLASYARGGRSNASGLHVRQLFVLTDLN